MDNDDIVTILTRFGNGEFKNVDGFKKEAYRLKELSKLKQSLPGLLREPHWEAVVVKYPMLTDEALHSYLGKFVIHLYREHWTSSISSSTFFHK